jgi:hypothetical protein
MRIRGALLLVVATAGLSGCWFRKKAPKPLPPLTPPVIILPAPAPRVDLPPEATNPIQVEPPPPPPEVTIIKPELHPRPENTQPKPKPSTRRPAAAQTPPAPPATSLPTATPEPTTEAPAAPPPQLGELISEDRRLELRNEVEQSLGRARATLAIASQRALTRRQNETAKRVRTFVQQAEDATSRDISTAVQLARRADLLAQDLAATFK